MKGYEDLCAGLMVLAAVLLGGYFYLHSEVFEQKKALHQAVVQDKMIAENKVKSEKTIFERASKRTELEE